MTVVLVVIPPCVAPIPASPTRNKPSTNTLSPIANGSVTNPFVGVSRKQVTTPAFGYSDKVTEFIPTPLELFTATTLWLTESNPLIGAIKSTLDTVWLGAIACNDEVSTTIFETGLKTIKLGALE